MQSPFAFPVDALTTADVSALRELADILWDRRHEIASEWAHRLSGTLQPVSPVPVSLEPLAALNEAFLSLILSHIRQGDLPTLYQLYYERTRQLIEIDLQRAPAGRVSLSGLYASARVSLGVIEARLRHRDGRLMLAYTKLTAQLMMLVGQAYSDSREEYLRRTFEQINMLSHELRTPLSHLFSYLEMLHGGDFGTVSPEQERVLSDLIHETDDLLLLLTGTLDLSRLDAGRVDVRVEEFPLETVFTDVVNSTPHLSALVKWSVAANVPVLRTDRVKVKQILTNLVRNAVHYGAGPVFMTAARPQPDRIEVSVLDHGPGIKPEDLGVIFDFFQQGGGQAAQLTRDGYGIGLHVVRRLVGLLGGTIEVDSVVGEGTCFRFTLPLEGPASPHTP